MSNQPLRIIIAEDEPDLQRYYRAIASRMGHEVVTVVANGDELVEQIEQHDPDLVITDINMPGKSGLEVIDQVQAGTRFVVISAAEDQESNGRGNAAIIARLRKPVTMDDIADAIGRATGSDTSEQSE